VCTPSNTWFPGPTRLSIPNGISIGSAVFAGHTIVTDRPTDRTINHATRSITIGRIYVRSYAMRPNSNKSIIGRPFLKRFALCYQTVDCPVCHVCLPCLSMTLVDCGQTVGWIKMKLAMQVGLHPDHIVLDGDPGTQLTLPQRGTAPQFWANVRCRQTAGWTKMPLGMELGLGTGDFVFDVDLTQLPQKKGHSPHPIFGPCLLWPNGWMDQDATWYGGKPRSRRRLLHGSQLPHQRGTAASFLPMSIMAKRLDG